MGQTNSIFIHSSRSSPIISILLKVEVCKCLDTFTSGNIAHHTQLIITIHQKHKLNMTPFYFVYIIFPFLAKVICLQYYVLRGQEEEVNRTRPNFFQFQLPYTNTNRAWFSPIPTSLYQYAESYCVIETNSIIPNGMIVTT